MRKPFGAALLVCFTLTCTSALSVEQSTAGMRLAATCVNCHGMQGVAPPPAAGEAYGDLSGWPRNLLLDKLQVFRRTANNGSTTLMHQLIKGYSEEELQLIADYFAALPRPTKK
jgi:cytochrome c553